MSDVEIPDWDKLYKNAEEYIETEQMKFIFQEAEKFLSANVAITESFRNRAIQCLSFIVPTMMAIIGFLIKEQNIVYFPLVFGLLALLTASFYLLEIINTKVSTFPGCLSSALLCGDWKNKHAIALLFTQCEEYEKRNTARIALNTAIGNQFKKAMALIAMAPFITFTLFVLFFLCTRGGLSS